MMKRVKSLLLFLRGDFVVLRVNNSGQLDVDSGNISKEQLPKVASKFFNKVHNL